MIAKYIDHTILRPNTALEDIQQVCEEASVYSFAAVCVPPYFVSKASSFLKGSEIQVATVIGFPFGYSHYISKLEEVKKAIEDGAEELDMVMNIAAFKNKDYAYIQEEAETILEVVKKNGKTLKVIIETGLLGNEEIIRCCELYKKLRVDFLKTSTGYAERGASIEAVLLMRQNLPEHIQIKASGGIKTYEFAESLLKAGATRLGCSASVAIVKGEKGGTEGY